MGNCDFRSAPQTNDKDVTFEQEKYKAKSSGPVLIQDTENNKAPNVEIDSKDENDYNPGHKEITFNNYANDPSQPAILQHESFEQQHNVEVDVDQVVYVDSKEQNREDDIVKQDDNNEEESLEFECTQNTNVELTNKKKTETFKVEHPMKIHGIDNFKKGFKNKIVKDIVKAN